jgi:RNA polymerase sigma-70 factor (family 1)
MINKDDFKALFDKYYDSIRLYIYYKIAEKEIADDMAQDVFMTVWEKKTDMELRNIKSLLYKIASGLVVDYYRKCDVKADFKEWVHYNGSEFSVSADEQVEYNEAMQRYVDALNSMHDGQREVFMMNREEQLTYREIAERLQISVKAVEKRMSGALKVLNDNMLTL